MVKMHKLTKGGQTIYPATIYDAVVNPNTRKSLAMEISELKMMSSMEAGLFFNSESFNQNFSYGNDGVKYSSLSIRSTSVIDIRQHHTPVIYISNIARQNIYNVISMWKENPDVNGYDGDNYIGGIKSRGISVSELTYRLTDADVGYIALSLPSTNLNDSTKASIGSLKDGLLKEISTLRSSLGRLLTPSFNLLQNEELGKGIVSGKIETAGMSNYKLYSMPVEKGKTYYFYQETDGILEQVELSYLLTDINGYINSSSTLLYGKSSSVSISDDYMLMYYSSHQSLTLMCSDHPVAEYSLPGNSAYNDLQGQKELSKRLENSLDNIGEEIKLIDAELENKADIKKEFIYPNNYYNRGNPRLGYYDSTGQFVDDEKQVTTEKVMARSGDIIRSGYFKSVGENNLGEEWTPFNVNQYICIWKEDGTFERISSSKFPDLPYIATENCEVTFTWYKGSTNITAFNMERYYGMVVIGDIPINYSDYFNPYIKKTLDKEIELPHFENLITREEYQKGKLVPGEGIRINGNVISATYASSIASFKLNQQPIVYNGTYQIETRLAGGEYETLPMIENATELLFVSEGKVNETSGFLFGRHRLGIYNNDCIKSYDKQVSTYRDGILPLEFHFDGDAIELSHRGYLTIRVKINEGNGWRYLTEVPMPVASQDGTINYTQIKFDSIKHRDIIIENKSSVRSFRYNSEYQVSPLDMKRPLAVFAGSSITECSAAGEFPLCSWASVASWALGFECINIGVGSRGIVTPTSDRPSIADAISDITYFVDADYIFIGGAINDKIVSIENYQQQVDIFIKKLVENMANSKIIILSPFMPQPDNLPNSQFEQKDTALKNIAEKYNLPYISEMEGMTMLSAGALKKATPWITGTFSSSSTDTMKVIGNCARVYNHQNGSIDHTHPGREGHKIIGLRFADAMVRIM